MNFGTDNGISKKRKVFYDEYTGGFYTETHMDELKRKCDYRYNVADVLNRSEEAKLQSALKTVKAARNLFELKLEKEATFHRDNLKDYRAYKQVLDGISKENGTQINWDDRFGRYGMGVNKKDLNDNIQLQLHEMDPMTRRKRHAENLLSQRKKPEVFNRKLKTHELLALRKNKRRSPSPRRTPKPGNSSSEKSVAKLILPPISVSKNRNESGNDSKRVNFLGLDVNVDPEADSSVLPAKTIETSLLPSIFVTNMGED